MAEPVEIQAAASSQLQIATPAKESNAKRPHPESSPVQADRRFPQKNGGNGNENNSKQQRRPPKKKLKGGKRLKAVTDGSAEEVLLADVQALQKALRIKQDREATDAEPVLFRGHNSEEVRATAVEAADEAKIEEDGGHDPQEDLPEPGTEIELDVVDLSSTGEGLAVQRKLHSLSDGPLLRRRRRIYVVSFSVPGDIVRAKVYRHLPQPKPGPGEDELPPTYSVADFLEVIRPSPELRDPLGDSNRVRCQYFGRCSGCQYQMLDYEEQLRIKRRVVERAYRHFSQLPPESIPAVRDTLPSPLQYGYRTKLTPHFDGPPGFRRRNKDRRTLTVVPDIGFMAKAGTGGARTTLDIESCPIGTPAVGLGMTRERARVARDFASYSKGATILLRESTKRCPKGAEGGGGEVTDDADAAGAVRVEGETYTDLKTCITDNNATSTEYVDDYIFTNPAGSFFQNNNSILPPLTAYVRENVLPKTTNSKGKELRYLIDAYSGSGLFTITLASTLPGGSIGIDIADQSITYARTNAQLNNLPPERCRFLAADAAQLFQSVIEYDPDETVVVLDPPRKGCDAPFLRQLLAFAPARIVYVSCNVHTQARDVGMLVRGHVDWGNSDNGVATTIEAAPERKDAKPPARYEIESLRGFDFFPQTAHVEGIAVLNRVDLV
ncbi:tRNA(m5U54)methyltransferase [Sporothrix eucalyptigena]|uniref:tRNA(M5U54)methyltransferase n=1 Tax=Sporothrix eucalyptigena TaxID=1812306 RepID=A0ABP0D210_9PEZI